VKSLALQGMTASWWIAQFELFKNDHLVFSLPLSNVVGITLMVAAMMVVAWLGWRRGRRGNGAATFGAVLMLVGAASNLFDRLYYGFVIDWANLGRWWPVFNVADVMIFVGLLLLVFRPARLDPVRSGKNVV
jgi:lipoprotein signal peptidase